MPKFSHLLCSVIFLCSGISSYGQQKIDSIMPFRGFCISAPKPAGLNRFITFIEQELAPKKVNLLVLRVDYNYQFTSYPALSDSGALSKQDVKKLVDVCKANGIKIVPQINLLGHQSWHSDISNLLAKYPEFDETPHVKLPEKYVWPNADGLYCKSYCPLHPEVHKVVFAVMDEICDVFEADAFHAGMDEVFYIGEDSCNRCRGRDKAELYADEVNKIQNRLAQDGRALWIWGDRLLDGSTTGMGMWEASMNNTHRSVDMISKDVVICDWHYERPVQTAVYLAMKGFKVITCPWRNAAVAAIQTQDMARFRKSSPAPLRDRYLGMMQTIWTSADNFLNEYYGVGEKPKTEKTSTNCFNTMIQEINKLAAPGQ